jgi:hypothetical protein
MVGEGANVGEGFREGRRVRSVLLGFYSKIDNDELKYGGKEMDKTYVIGCVCAYGDLSASIDLYSQTKSSCAFFLTQTIFYRNINIILSIY